MESKVKILVVDNDPGFIVTLQSFLQEKDFSVLTAVNRIYAQDSFRTEKPDLVIIGTIMPRGDAFQLHRWLKDTPSSRSIPLIIADAPPEKSFTKGWTRDEGLQNEAEEFFRKPVNPDVLLARINKLLDRTTRRISILIADDHPIVREGICALIALQKDMQVVGEAVNGRDALRKTLQLSPDVVLMDIVMPEMSGLEATRQICKEYEQAKVLMLSQYDDYENVLASSNAGAMGFIPKRTVSSQLLAGIRCVSTGRPFTPRSPN
jgi:DNA-binding NarL/FixJ family response regulator